MNYAGWVGLAIVCAALAWLAVSQTQDGMAYCTTHATQAQCEAWMEAGL